DAVRHAARAAEDRGLAGLRVVLPDVAGLQILAGRILAELRERDVAEVDHTVVPGSDAFGQNATAVEDALELRAGRNIGLIADRRGESRIIREGGGRKPQGQTEGGGDAREAVLLVHFSS